MTAPAGLGALRPMSLEQVNSLASLTMRACRKYIAPADLLTGLVERLEPDFGVLSDGERTSFRYSSTYLDTPDLLTFRHHRQERRRRFKIRTRTYLDSALTMFEVKLKGGRGATDKQRVPHDGRPGELTAEARAFLGRTLRDYGADVPGALLPVATTDYRRSTVVAFSGRERITCDSGLVCSYGGHSAAMRPDLVLLEVKTLEGTTDTERLLHRLGLRPVSFSKYGAAVAVMNPGAGANRWRRPLRLCFDRL
ncbi:polyphosphate polymerase domain-containing protein [Actinorugispora endophytica]|uniref:VTC domain-containing protein n=1 Tax=Actinorugispora endophytica TaxID=1605990 RepID=A0A4V3D8W0_9ACTN|nr:polyphosphate polymerase domain-containing protein [Actinorugispora endophytica]TDQ53299.1 VTC domain-containing protein [Actinorugispora endophytica]